MRNKFLLPVLFLIIASCADKNKTTPETTNDDKVIPETKTETMENKADEKDYYVKLSTDYGDMVIKLYNETPQHRDNFIKLVKTGFYDDLLFHRVIKEFMIQGGDPDSRNADSKKMLGVGGPGYTVPAEFRTNLIHKKGALSAARMGDQGNPTKASSGSQFYIVQGKKYSDAELTQLERGYGMVLNEQQKKTYREVGGTPSLDYNYTVFGEVTEGLDVIDKIAAVQTGAGDRPVKDVKMKITILEK